MAQTTISRPPLLKSLSARLLVLTAFFVMLSEVLIYVPSIARFRLVYLEHAEWVKKNWLPPVSLPESAMPAIPRT